MKKYFVSVIAVILIICCFCACGKVPGSIKTDDKNADLTAQSSAADNVGSTHMKDATDIVLSYFEYYEKGDFENMKPYCSEKFVEQYFHKGDVFGSKKSSLIKVDSVKYDEQNNRYKICVEERVTPVKSSAYYDEEKSQVDVYHTYVLKTNVNGQLVITAFANDEADIE